MNSFSACLVFGLASVSVACGGAVTVEGGGGSGGSDGEVAATTAASQSAVTTGTGAGGCTVVGTWDGVSGVDGTNPPSSASYRFNADGTWVGGAYQEDPVATQFMQGNYSVAGGIVTLSGAGMGPECGASVAATYGLTMTDSCQQMHFQTQTDNCTGARLYISAAGDGTAFTKRH